MHLDKPSDNENRKYFDSSAITLVVNSRDIISTNLELCLILLKYCLIHKFFISVRFSLKFSHQTRNIQFVHLVLCCQVAWHLTKTQKFLIGSVNFCFFCGTISRGSHRYITLLICCANFVKIVMAYLLVFTVRAVDNLYFCCTPK